MLFCYKQLTVAHKDSEGHTGEILSRVVDLTKFKEELTCSIRTFSYGSA